MASTPTIEIGVLSSETIHFKWNGPFRCSAQGNLSGGEGYAALAGDSSIILHTRDKRQVFSDFVLLEPVDEESASFELFQVLIGVKFHWEREETQTFKGKLKIFPENGRLTAVNILPLEDYLLSVIASEMNAASSLEFLKAHAVISRSWLLAQMEKRKKIGETGSYQALIRNDEGYIRWYDREDHRHFDVCADDHCQRYQGIGKISSEQVYEALQTTAGEVLTYRDAICDARFYKCCGGITEAFENVWEPAPHPYLVKVVDRDFPEQDEPDLTKEENARKWILSSPPAYCNTRDKELLSQALNGYDCETTDFYRWETVLTQAEIKSLLFRKAGIDLGNILDLIPVERGVSGRLVRLRIVGSKQTLVIGKELEIRKVLSETHLYSSAFVVEKGQKVNGVPEKFILKGAGWGHGVGLCQIGAAVMGAKGHSYREILTHYFPGAVLQKIY
ncbi:MAG: SpoIID/LytB domain-containing protein [Candidatus Symbiothrix sp.]|jgi:SpoIID/LytB domain protein|nr:SpoIID/LytB domain-containing protein [Candidatus Symbiothrix sp.]